MFKFVFLFLSVAGVFCSQDDLQVKTPYGTYIGHVVQARSGRELIAFNGIPFAQPPVGPLRFKEPVKLEKSDEVLVANKSHICYQQAMTLFLTDKATYVGEEDCLYLSVYKPKDVPDDKLLPVYVVIHGGGYLGGAEAWNGPKYLLDNKRDMVLVSTNYRLGIFGFLSVNNDTLTGNMGMKDQTMALKWVNENIKAFGGDPDSVTIGGASAGSSSVAQHIKSKASKGLFHRAISQGGTADCRWAQKSSHEAQEIASKYLFVLNCPTESDKVLECLQKIPKQKLVEVSESKDKSLGFVMSMVPVIEEDSPTAFMTKESMEEESTIPWLTGVSNEEGLGFFQMMSLAFPQWSNLSILNDNYKKILPLQGYFEHEPGKDAALEQIKDYYFKDGFNSDTVKNFIHYLSDFMFNHGLHVSSRKHKGKTFMYVFSYKGNYSISRMYPNPPPIGFEDSVPHGDDSVYIYSLDIPGFPLKFDMKDQDLEMSEKMVDMWYNFIVSGDPTPESHLWEDSEGGKKYLEFTNDGLVIRTDFYNERMKFLDDLEKTLVTA